MTAQVLTTLERNTRYHFSTNQNDELSVDPSDVQRAIHTILTTVNTTDSEQYEKMRAVVLSARGWENMGVSYVWTSDIIQYLYEQVSAPEQWMTKEGKLSKRISKAFYKTFDYTVDPKILAPVGEELHRKAIRAGDYYLDTTRNFDWEDGDYGDSGSCFWSYNSAAKDMILKLGGFAIRAYQDPHYEQGKARAWIVPVKYDGEECYYLFNTYGENKEYFVNAIKHLTGYTAKSVHLSNYGRTSNTFYINSNSGYCLYPHGVTVPDSYDFEVDDGSCTCDLCGERVDDDSYYDNNGNTYCSDCYYTIYARCENCDDEISRDDAVTLTLTREGWDGRKHTYTADYCEDCASEKGYVQCEDCDTWTNDFTGDEDHTVCTDCYNRGYSYCEDCECLVIHNRPYSDVPDAVTHGNKVYCTDCMENHADTCPDCGAPSEDNVQCADCHSKEVRAREGWNEPQLFDHAIRIVTYTNELFDYAF